jgi:hypothetical protein
VWSLIDPSMAVAMSVAARRGGRRIAPWADRGNDAVVAATQPPTRRSWLPLQDWRIELA